MKNASADAKDDREKRVRMMILYDPEDREEWLRCRCKGLGGSDAGTVLGVNKYKTNVELWREKTGIDKNTFQGNEATEYGKAAEKHIREMFLLDYPQFSCEYHEYRMHANQLYQFLYATLDGELTERSTGKKGVLEIKTTTIHNPSQWDEWDGRIPQTYYAQVLHQLVATGYEFVILRAYIRYYDKDGELRATVRDYRIEYAEVQDDIAELVKAEVQFWHDVINKNEPALILPAI